MKPVSAVLLFLIDGLCPDVLQQAETPVLDRLMAKGSSTLTAQTVMPSITLPCITSLFLGVDPQRHTITTNVWEATRPMAGLFELLHQNGLKTASCHNWEPLRDLSRPGALDFSLFMNNCYDLDGDLVLAESAAPYLAKTAFGFTFVYLGYTDSAGHADGYRSAPYRTAIERADLAIGLVLEALRSAGRLQDTVVLVTSDHGGHAKSHGEAIPEDLTIPWIISGPGIRRGYTLSKPVSILDNAPTIATLLGFSPLPAWEGKPVTEALANAE